MSLSRPNSWEDRSPGPLSLKKPFQDNKERKDQKQQLNRVKTEETRKAMLNQIVQSPHHGHFHTKRGEVDSALRDIRQRLIEMKAVYQDNNPLTCFQSLLYQKLLGLCIAVYAQVTHAADRAPGQYDQIEGISFTLSLKGSEMILQRLLPSVKLSSATAVLLQLQQIAGVFARQISFTYRAGLLKLTESGLQSFAQCCTVRIYQDWLTNSDALSNNPPQQLLEESLKRGEIVKKFPLVTKQPEPDADWEGSEWIEYAGIQTTFNGQHKFYQHVNARGLHYGYRPGTEGEINAANYLQENCYRCVKVESIAPEESKSSLSPVDLIAPLTWTPFAPDKENNLTFLGRF